MTLTPLQMAAALCEQVYRRADQQQQLGSAIASPVSADGKANEADIAGIAIWASVSESVSAKITQQVQAGVFPIRLQPGDWTSGKINWLLDVIAPTPQ
jgi:cytolysin-activating lysine-acyltransferase